MRKVTMGFTVILLFTGSSILMAGSRAIAPLRDALRSERETQARYLACATEAETEGLAGAASLFRASARAEEIHANRFASLLKARGVIEEIKVETPTVGTTVENLHAAARRERGEVEDTYRALATEAMTSGDKEASDCLELARTSEIEHLNLYVALANSRDPAALKGAKTYHVCGACGYTTDVQLRACPACRAAKFIDIE